MPLEVNWAVENRVVLVKAIGHVTEIELDAYDEIVVSYLEQSDAHLIHLVLEATHLATMPMKPHFYTELGWATHPKLGWVIPVNLQNKAFRFLVSVVSQLLKNRLRMEDSTEEAIAFLHDIDPTIPMPEITKSKTS